MIHHYHLLFHSQIYKKLAFKELRNITFPKLEILKIPYQKPKIETLMKFLENNGNCGNGKRTGVIIDFFLQLKIRGLEPTFFLTDKDFAQISAARFIWKICNGKFRLKKPRLAWRSMATRIARCSSPPREKS